MIAADKNMLISNNSYQTKILKNSLLIYVRRESFVTFFFFL